MSRVLIAGATGMIGSLVLKECLERQDVDRVTCLLRRSTGVTHPKLREVMVGDLADLSDAASVFAGVDQAFYCVGAYTGALPPAEFRKVTVDHTISFARALVAASPGATLCFLSGEGADRTEKSRMQFARDKGAAENFLFACGLMRVHSFRPGYIFPVTPRKEPNFGYTLMRWLYTPLISWMAPNSSVRSTDLAQAMVKVAFADGGAPVLENKDIRALAR